MATPSFGSIAESTASADHSPATKPGRQLAGRAREIAGDRTVAKGVARSVPGRSTKGVVLDERCPCSHVGDLRSDVGAAVAKRRCGLSKRFFTPMRPGTSPSCGPPTRSAPAPAVDHHGSLVANFRLGGERRVVCVHNARSPGATSSLGSLRRSSGEAAS